MHLDAYRQINRQVWRDFERGEITAERLRLRRFERLFETVEIALTPERFSALYLEHLATGIDLIEGAQEMVAALHDAYRLAIITNGLKDIQRPRLARSPIGRYFAEVVISEEVGAAKPDARIFDAAFARLGNPERTDVLVIGDSLASDIAGGQRYGVDTCWFNPTGQPGGPDVESTYEIRSLTELRRLLL